MSSPVQYWFFAYATCLGFFLSTGAHAQPALSVGQPVNLARFARVQTWCGPVHEYPIGVKLQQASSVPQVDGVREVKAEEANDSVNIGLEWDEQHVLRTFAVTYADVAGAPGPREQELQMWIDEAQSKKRGGLVGGETPCQGVWRTITPESGLVVAVNGATWTYTLPEFTRGDFNLGVLKVRLVFEHRKSVQLRDIAAYSAAKWRGAVFNVRFDAPARIDRVDGLNAVVGQAKTGADGKNLQVEALASDASNDSLDRAIFTVRAGEHSFSFLYNDLIADGQIRVRPVGAFVTRPGPQSAPAEGHTVSSRVLEMPEQTYDRALKNVRKNPRNKFLSLSPPLNARKFAVYPDGTVAFRNRIHTHLQFATGESPDYDRVEPQHVEEDCLPVLYADWRDGDLEWRQGYVVTTLGGKLDALGQPTVLVSQVTVTNRRSSSATARFWSRIKGKRDKPSPDLPTKYLVFEANEWQYQEREGQVLYTAEVKPGESRSVQIKMPSDEPLSSAVDLLKGIDFEQARTQTIDYWHTKLREGADFVVPDERINRLWKSLLIHQYCWSDYEPKRKEYRANCAAFAYGPVGNESSQMAKTVDLFGRSDLARDFYEPMWKMQGTDKLHARVTNGQGCLTGWWTNYVFNTGFILWNLGEHYRLTGDRAWLDQVVPNMIKACDWITEQRATTVGNAVDGSIRMESGFFPPCSIEDDKRWRYWVMTNGYLYLGLRTTADILAEIKHPDADRLDRQARAYLEDLRRGIGESIVRSPVVRLRDGTYVPNVPKHLDRRGRSEEHYETELGALHLITCGVYGPASAQADWMLNFHEDAVYLTESPDHRPLIPLQSMEEDWFDLGGYGKCQPYLVHTALTYLRRDEPKLFLRSFWNNLVAMNFADINAFPELIAADGGGECKTYEEAMWLQQFRGMLVFDQDDVLRLATATPREWLADGKTIAVRNAPTRFGAVTYEIRSQAGSGHIRAQVELAGTRAPSSGVLRLRHPTQARIKTVTVNGRTWDRYDAEKECILLPLEANRLSVDAEYAK